MVTDREAFIEKNMPLVRAVANRFRGRGADDEDLYQAGCVGLIKAADGFDEGRGFAFSTYAVPVIMGEIKRLFRDGCAMKVSRSLREQSVRVQQIRDAFVRKEQREPTVTELAQQCALTTEALGEILGILTPAVSLNDDSEDVSPPDIPVDESDRLFDRLVVNAAMDSLSETERLHIRLRYYEGKTQCETAEMLGISQVQVSRREKALLMKLRKLLE